MNHTEQPFDEIVESRLFPRDIPEEGRVVCRIMHDGWEIGTWLETDWEGAGPVAQKILAVNDLLEACEQLLALVDHHADATYDDTSFSLYESPAREFARSAIAKAKGTRVPDGLSRADADLIAAAPDLLVVCKNAIVTLGVMAMPRLDATVADNTTLLRILSESLHAAIAKAEGTTP